jgi:glucose-6-phosphate 1-dehydrogenase
MVGDEVELVAHEDSADHRLLPYARLLGDALRGDLTLFNRQDAVDAAWRVIQPVLDHLPPLFEYEPNTWGPTKADSIAENIGGWHNPLPSIVENTIGED